MVIQPGSSLKDDVYEFCSNGLLEHSDFISKWDFENGIITISHNDGYAIVKCQILENVLQGTASNETGKKWTFKGELISKGTSAITTNNLNLLKVSNDNQNSLIESIYATIEDYRADENTPNVGMTTDRIRNWINQFDHELRVPILTQLNNIFKERYCSKSKVKDFLDQVVRVMTKDFNFNSASEFLKNSDFLNLQPKGKSQSVMLSLFDELIQEKYGLSLADCGITSKKYSIYIDDILCTGLTLISDIKEWSEQIFTVDKTNRQAVADNSTTLVFAYIFIHKRNYFKKVFEMRKKISHEVSSKHKMYRFTSIENDITTASKINFICPIEEGQTERVINYKAEIVNKVDNHVNGRWITKEEFYRSSNLPILEEFFTSPENRRIVENAFLQKGIEILDNANSQISNMRALGYSLPSLKDFGFGALCFTWRNIPNNAPLVFWYSGGGFTPLFKVTRGGNFIFNLKSENESFYSALNEEWKEIVKWNIIGLDTEQDREKVFNNTYHPSKDELDKIDTTDELWINWWENDPPNDEFGVSDLSPIEMFKNISSLIIRSLNVENCNPIASCKNLKSLLIQHSKTNNLDFLKDLTSINILDLQYNPITNIQPIMKLVELTSLDLSSTNIENIDSLSGLTKLKSLSISYTNVRNLEPLSNLINLRELWLGDTNITSISPLFGLNIQHLVLNNDNVDNAEVSYFVKKHPNCRVFYKGTTYNESKSNFDLPF